MSGQFAPSSPAGRQKQNCLRWVTSRLIQSSLDGNSAPTPLITPREKAAAYHVHVADGVVREDPIPVEIDRLVSCSHQKRS